MGLVTLWKNWLPWSQGVVIAPLLAKFRNPSVRIFWFVTLLITTAAFVYQSVCMVQDYLAYHKTTQIQLFYEPDAPFPAVTFCNLNPFKRSMLHHSKELSNLLTVYNYVKKVKQAQQLSTHATRFIVAHNRFIVNNGDVDNVDNNQPSHVNKHADGDNVRVFLNDVHRCNNVGVNKRSASVIHFIFSGDSNQYDFKPTSNNNWAQYYA